MRKIFVTLIIFACVEMYLSQDIITSKEKVKPHPFADLEPFLPEDFNKPPVIEKAPCYISDQKCLQKLKGTVSVCGVENGLRLITYHHKCQIYLINCLARPLVDKTAYGVVSRNDNIYYNGKNHTCHYYFKKAGISEAVSFYYKTGFVTEDIEDNKIDTQE